MQALPPATPRTCFQTPPENTLFGIIIFFVFLANLDDGGANCEPLAGLELCGEGEEATVLHIQVVVHLGGGELETLSGQNLKLFLCNMLIYGCPLE